MMMLSEVASALNATMNTTMRGHDTKIRSVGTDSRSIVKGQLFVGIKGESFDGSAFAMEAIKQGAVAAIVTKNNTEATPAILVEDTRLALGDLAHYWRKKFDLPLVAVTGSSGKTTVKEMITAIINAANGKVLATRGNLNNDIGMPLTLLNMNKNHTHAVIEMGMNHEGEIRYLTKLAMPMVALVNNAGTAHIGELGSREAIARAKGEIFEGLADEGIAVINADDDFADYWKSLNKARKVITFGLRNQADVSAIYQLQGDCSKINLKTPNGEAQFKLHVLGFHNIQNALAASAVSVALGISAADIAKGLAQFSSVKGRLNWFEGINGAAVIDDTYNANPDSMKAAIDVLSSQKSTRLFVMGDMGELGRDAQQMHREIGAYAKEKGIQQFFSFGELSRLASEEFSQGLDGNAQHFHTLEGLLEALREHMKNGVIVLVKGSRFMKMERVVNAIVKEKLVMEAH